MPHRALLFLFMILFVSPLTAADWPEVSELPVNEDYPAVLKMFDGSTVSTVEEWEQKRRPELKELFQHYMYGYFPDAPAEINFDVQPEFVLLEGKARGFEVVITYKAKQGGETLPPLNLLVVLPTKTAGPVPLFLGINFCGNHTLLPNKEITLSPSWVYDSCGG
ncbi:MAG: acetylxylan esterase, partial [Planctomyces sp.]|nr:acetylxylan esterase [Planctomyces sp.]